MKTILATLVAALLASCTTVESIAISQIPVTAQRQHPIRAHAWSPMILFIPFGSGFVDDARAELLSQCSGGAIEGMLTKFEDTDYFLGIYETQAVTLEGYCVRRKG